jgi:hypothetical protein
MADEPLTAVGEVDAFGDQRRGGTTRHIRSQRPHSEARGLRTLPKA